MFKVAVFKLKDITKYITYITITILLVISSFKIFSNVKKIKIEKIELGNNIKNMENQIISIKKYNKDKNKNSNKKTKEEIEKSCIKNIINSEICSIREINKEKQTKDANENVETNDSKEINEDVETKNNEEIKNDREQNKEKKEEIKLASKEVNTEVITNNPIKEVYNTTFGKVKIKNGTSINLTEEIMKPNIKIDNKNILIFHTHTCESYTPSEKLKYEQTGNYRTTDLKYSVARLGDELEKYIKEYKIPVIHDKTYHDYPAYNGSYTRSLQTVQNLLKENKSDIIIDIHRDAIGSRSDYAPIVKIGDEIAAQIMYVIGTNEGGLEHPNWEQNLKFAIKVQQKAEEMYPGLFKPIMLTKYRYNQHTGKHASIMEVGATGNTLEQSMTSMKYLAKVLDEVLK